MSKSSTLFAVLACLVSGALGAVIASITMAPPPPAAPSIDAGAPSTAAIEREIAALRDDNAELLRRVLMLEDRPAARETTREVVVAPSPAEQEKEAELQGLAAVLHDPKAPVPENLRATVGEALKTIRADEDRERRDRAAQLAAARIDDRLNDLTVKLGLVPGQTHELRDLFVTHTAKREELWRTVRESGDFTLARDSIRDLRESMDRGLEQILTPMQLEEYRKLEERDGRFDGMGPPRRTPREEGN